MKGDFSRNSFNPQKNYRTVRMQQGRVLLDADWNEMVDVILGQQTAGLRNLVGAHGGLGDGFKIAFAEDETKRTGSNSDVPHIFLHAGQYYIQGYSCTLEETILFGTQPDFPGAEEQKREVLKNGNQWILYLDVWERHLTAIEDPDLAEPSLGGADTTTRTKVVWQVKLLSLHDRDLWMDPQKTAELPEWLELVRAENHQIWIDQGHAIENELFRIEIHAGNEDGMGRSEATWKWSRDNASIAFPIHALQVVTNDHEKQGLPYLRITVDDNQHLQELLSQDDYVELECDEWVLDGRPGWLGQITQVEAPDEDGRQKLIVTALQSVKNEVDPAFLQHSDDDRGKMKEHHPLLRRWNRVATSRLPGPSLDLDLEHGIKVKFTEEKYRTGDHWIIPVRSGEMPNREMNISQANAAHAFAPLALLTRQGAAWEIHDLRRIFLNLGDVFVELEALQAELEETKESLEALYIKTGKEYQEQEAEIGVLQKELAALKLTVDQLPILTIQQFVKSYRSDEILEIGEVVARALIEEDCITRASRKIAPIGVIAPRLRGGDMPDEYSVVLSGPVICRIYGQVKAGDLLVAAQEPGALEKASLWERWFEADRIVARAIDNPTGPEDRMINVYFMPHLMK